MFVVLASGIRGVRRQVFFRTRAPPIENFILVSWRMFAEDNVRFSLFYIFLRQRRTEGRDSLRDFSPSCFNSARYHSSPRFCRRHAIPFLLIHRLMYSSIHVPRGRCSSGDMGHFRLCRASVLVEWATWMFVVLASGIRGVHRQVRPLFDESSVE